MLVESERLHGRSLGGLQVRGLDKPEQMTAVSDDDDAPAT